MAEADFRDGLYISQTSTAILCRRVYRRVFCDAVDFKNAIHDNRHYTSRPCVIQILEPYMKNDLDPKSMVVVCVLFNFEELLDGVGQYAQFQHGLHSMHLKSYNIRTYVRTKDGQFEEQTLRMNQQTKYATFFEFEPKLLKKLIINGTVSFMFELDIFLYRHLEDVKPLQSLCIGNVCANLTPENVLDVLPIASALHLFRLQDQCINLIQQHIDTIRLSPAYEKLNSQFKQRIMDSYKRSNVFVNLYLT